MAEQLTGSFRYNFYYNSGFMFSIHVTQPVQR